MDNANVALCNECAEVKVSQTTVGRLMEEGFALYKEGVRKDHIKLLDALDKYYEALKALKESNGHSGCISYINNEYKRLYRSIQGSRA